MRERKILNQEIVKTRADHICYGCGRNFPKNTQMNSMSCSINGSVDRKYLCESCQNVVKMKNITIDKFWYGDLLLEALAYEKRKFNKSR